METPPSRRTVGRLYRRTPVIGGTAAPDRLCSAVAGYLPTRLVPLNCTVFSPSHCSQCSSQVSCLVSSQCSSLVSVLQTVDGVLWRLSRLQTANGVQLSFMPANYVSIHSQGLTNMHMSIQLLCVQTMPLHVARGNGKIYTPFVR